MADKHVVGAGGAWLEQVALLHSSIVWLFRLLKSDLHIRKKRQFTNVWRRNGPLFQHTLFQPFEKSDKQHQFCASFRVFLCNIFCRSAELIYNRRHRVVMVRLPSLIPFLIFMLCLYLVSQLSQCSTVLNHQRQSSADGRSIFRRKISHQSKVSQVLSQMWQFSPRAHLSKKQLETDDKFINLTALPSNDERAMNAVYSNNSNYIVSYYLCVIQAI